MNYTELTFDQLQTIRGGGIIGGNAVPGGTSF